MGLFDGTVINWGASGVYVGANLVLTCAHVVRNSSYPVLPPFRLSGTGETKEVRNATVVTDSKDIAFVGLDGDPWPTNDAPCIAAKPLVQGEPITFVSHPNMVFPAIVAHGTVSDPEVRLTTDPDPKVPRKERSHVYSIVARLAPEQADRVTYGSSGGAAHNARGELIGLIWSGRVLDDGSADVLVTPASAWLGDLEQALAAAGLDESLVRRCEPTAD